jgi:aminopeptidase-like protein
MLHATATLTFPDGAKVIGEFISRSRYGDPILLSGAVERLPAHEPVTSEYALQARFATWAKELGASYDYRWEGSYEIGE